MEELDDDVFLFREDERPPAIEATGLEAVELVGDALELEAVSAPCSVGLD